MKRVYFAGKFNLVKDKNLPMCERLKDDFRAKILGNSNTLVNASKDIILSSGVIYNGPFYSEEASNGDFTSTDCNVVLDAEFKAVKSSDVYFALFDKKFSVGTIVELGWALEMNKEIIIFYEEEESEHDIKSEYWFAILNAIKTSNKVKVFKFNDIDSVVDKVKSGEVFNEV